MITVAVIFVSLHFYNAVVVIFAKARRSHCIGISFAIDIGSQKVVGTGQLHAADKWTYFFLLLLSHLSIGIYPAFRFYCFHFNEEEVNKWWT